MKCRSSERFSIVQLQLDIPSRTHVTVYWVNRYRTIAIRLVESGGLSDGAIHFLWRIKVVSADLKCRNCDLIAAAAKREGKRKEGEWASFTRLEIEVTNAFQDCEPGIPRRPFGFQISIGFHSNRAYFWQKLQGILDPRDRFYSSTGFAFHINPFADEIHTCNKWA